MKKKQWFVFYTKSRQEKKVRDLLLKSGYEVFLPMHKVMRQWSDRKKKVEVPLFNSYIFVNDLDYNIPFILKIPGVSWNIKSNGKPAVLRLDELELINRFILTGLTLEASDLDRNTLKTGDKAKIIDGPLTGVVGVISGNPNNEKFNVLIEGIDQVIRVQVPAFLLKKL